jgi:1-hydroxycarotenoid 3,4-desaturase
MDNRDDLVSTAKIARALANMTARHVAVVGAGVAGLVAAVALAARGVRVTVFERAATPGGKLREVEIDGQRLDVGPTVFTMRWVFDEIFADAGTELAAHLDLQPIEILARHAWPGGQQLDLWADLDRASEAIAAFAGPEEGRRYRRFCADARAVYTTLEQPFIRAARPTLSGLLRGGGVWRLGQLKRTLPFTRLWDALGAYFHDPRLRQLFARYATYCGSSPFLAPATLMLIAHVEREGVWLVKGGMYRLAEVLAGVAETLGAGFRYCAEVNEIRIAAGRPTAIGLTSGEQIAVDAVVINADVAAISAGRFGSAVAKALPGGMSATRSLSALTWAMLGETAGFPLLRHTVFFSTDYAAEFDDIFIRRRLPRVPTVYVCAQDRDDTATPPQRRERLLCLVNAPATAAAGAFSPSEISECESRTFHLLAQCGLQLHRRPELTRLSTPRDFARLFPETAGALYGQALHHWTTSFRRPHARTPIAGVYLAGGSVHPGPGVPMAALSGRAAAASLLADLALPTRSRPTATHGGILTR